MLPTHDPPFHEWAGLLNDEFLRWVDHQIDLWEVQIDDARYSLYREDYDLYDQLAIESDAFDHDLRYYGVI